MSKLETKTYDDLLLVPQPRLEATIQAKHKYTIEERSQLLEELTEADTQLAEAEEGLKAAKAEWKSRIEGIEAERKEVSGRARNGYEMEAVECLVVLNPKGKVKYFHHAETLERLDTQPMTQSDFQMQMNFERDNTEEEDES